MGILLLGTPASIVSSGTGLQINLVPTASWLTAPADYQTKMQTAANIMMAAFPGTNCTVNIQLEYGSTYRGTSLPNRNSASNDESTNGISYGTIKSAFSAISNPTTELTSVINSLPGGSTLGGQTNFFVSYAICKTIGLLGTGGGPATTTDAGLDGFIGMGTGWTSAETLGVSLHEMRQVLGGIISRATFCFSRFKSVGVWDPGSFYTTAYFSLDGGTTNLASFGNSSDLGDLLNGTTDPGSGLWDCFNESQNNSLQDLSPLDLKMMKAMGYR